MIYGKIFLGRQQPKNNGTELDAICLLFPLFGREEKDGDLGNLQGAIYYRQMDEDTKQNDMPRATTKRRDTLLFPHGNGTASTNTTKPATNLDSWNPLVHQLLTFETFTYFPFSLEG